MRSKNFLLTCLFICYLLNNACSETATRNNPADKIVFSGSTPGDEAIKSLLAIRADAKVDFIKWNLILTPDTSDRSTFTLDIVFGEAQQNTLDFKGGGEKLSFTGKYTVKVNNTNFKGEIYYLESSRLPAAILLRKINENLFHLLTSKKAFMVGDAGYSYTLNRINPVATSDAVFSLQTAIPLQLENHLDTIVAFTGRSLCSPELLELNGISAGGCRRIKWGLTLYWDAKTHLPTTFQLRSIYVGTGDSIYTTNGKWEAMKTDSHSIVYLLKFNEAKKGNLTFLKGDDNVLFLLDKNGNLMVGNGDHSYTLNKKK